MKRRNVITAIFCLLLVPLGFFFAITAMTGTDAVPVREAAELEGFDFSSRIAVLLPEIFDAYPSVLLSPVDFEAGAGIAPESPGRGDFATYRLVVPLEEGVVYGLSGYSATHSMVIWIDGSVRYSVGVPADNLEGVEAGISHFTLFFTAEGGYTEIIIQRASFVHARGGNLSPLYLGEQSLISHMNHMSFVSVNLMTGVILMAFFVFFSLYFFLPNRKYFLWAALLCLATVLRTWIREHVLIAAFFPGIEWQTIHRLGFLSTNGFVAFSILFINAMFSDDADPKRGGLHPAVLVFSMVYLAVQSVVTIFTPPIFYTQFNTFFNVMITGLPALTLLNSAWIVLRNPAKRRLEHVLVVFAGLANILFGAAEAVHWVFSPVPSLGINYIQLGAAAFILIAAAALCVSVFRTETELIEERHRVELAVASSVAKSEFLAKMSHEIRTPMNVIMGMAELILREPLPDKVRTKATAISHSGEHLLVIINDILDFSKIESGKMQLATAPYDFRTVAQSTVDTIRLNMSGSTVKLTVEIGVDIPLMLMGDEVKVRQVLLNLLENAVKYTNEGEISFSASGVCAGEDGYVLTLRIKDSGIGIKADDIERIFGKFEQVDKKKNRNVEGAGLGLAITRGLVQLMGGTIEVNSEYGRGSEFIVSLPQEIVAAAEATDTPQADNAFTAPDACVLVVDDVELNLAVMEAMLEYFGIRAVLCRSGPEAIDAVKEGRFDLILMDQMMPQMDGTEAVAVIRGLGKEGGACAKLPIVALTANAVVGAKEMFLQSGFDDYLSKPVDIARLSEVLIRWLPKEKLHI